MGWYYKGDGSPATPTGQDRVNEISRLRDEAKQHFEASGINQRSGYTGHAASSYAEGVKCQEKADRLERGE